MPAEVDVSEEELRKQRKLEKKERKRREREQAEAEAPASTTPSAPTTTAAEPNLDEEEERLKRKAEKRERKRLRLAQADNINGAQPSSASSLPPASSSSSSPPPPLSLADAEFYRAAHHIHISQQDAHLLPITSFASAGFPPALLSTTSTFSHPTPIQSQCWPVLLAGRDCIAIADTGSGKTLGFVLPGLTHLLSLPPPLPSSTSRKRGSFTSGSSGPYMLILSPTRELALQTQAVTESASSALSFRTAVIYGGVDKAGQRRQLDAGVHTVVATPGRLLALIDEGLVSLRAVSFLVLDEADRMLDMGFEPDIRAIINHIGTPATTPTTSTTTSRRRRQTLMFSATWPTSVQKLASEFISSPVHISIGAVDLRANARVRQTILVLPPTDTDKQHRLTQLLSQHPPTTRILVFVLYKKEVDHVHRIVTRAGVQSVAVSGDKGQGEREAAVAAFKSGKVRAMIATDVVGRGLDIEGIDLVINYTFPLTVEDYVHRIGRTGRGGKSGQSITFFTKAEKHLSGELINVLRQGGEEVPAELLAFGTGVKRKEHGFFGQHFKQMAEGAEMRKPTKVKFDD